VRRKGVSWTTISSSCSFRLNASSVCRRFNGIGGLAREQVEETQFGLARRNAVSRQCVEMIPTSWPVREMSGVDCTARMPRARNEARLRSAGEKFARIDIRHDQPFRAFEGREFRR
jgi:hypothetical protein